MDREQRVAIEAARRSAKKAAKVGRQRGEQTIAEGVCHYGAASDETLALAFAWATTHRLVVQPVRSAAPVIIAFADVAELEVAGIHAVVTEATGRQHRLQFSGGSPFIDLQSALRAGVNVAHGRHWDD